jgi:hypothetical protein
MIADRPTPPDLGRGRNHWVDRNQPRTGHEESLYWINGLASAGSGAKAGS